MIKVMFICHGNICRSPMAEFVMKDMVERKGISDCFTIASCATSREEIGNDMHPGSKRKLYDEGIPFARRAARQLTREDYKEYDLLIAMDRYNLRNIMRMIGSDPENKVHLLLEYAGKDRDIADPWYTGNFDETYDDVKEGCSELLKRICKEEKIC